MSDRWESRAPNSLLSLLGPDGEPVTAPLDRRWLWRIENNLAVSATNDTQRQLARDLSQYLHETCEHHWLPGARSQWTNPDTGRVEHEIEEHRQCLWCDLVEWPVK